MYYYNTKIWLQIFAILLHFERDYEYAQFVFCDTLIEVVRVAPKPAPIQTLL